MGAKNWRFRWKLWIEKQNRREEKWTQCHADMSEDRTMVYAWMDWPGEKEEGEYHCKRERD